MSEAVPAELDRLLAEAMELQAAGRLVEGYERLRTWLRLRVARGDRMRAAAPAGRVSVPGTTLGCVDCRDHERLRSQLFAAR